MREFPLLDLHSAWQDAQGTLQEIVDRTERLFHASDDTWGDILRVQYKAFEALRALGDLPASIREGIAKDQADLDEMEARADG